MKLAKSRVNPAPVALVGTNAVAPLIEPNAASARLVNGELSSPTLEYCCLIRWLSSTTLPGVRDPRSGGPPATDPAAIGPASELFAKPPSVTHAMIAAMHCERRGADMQKPPCKENRRHPGEAPNWVAIPPPVCG